MDLDALDDAVEAFLDDCDARSDALVARRDLRKAILRANASGISDQTLATTFKRVSQAGLSRTRIQQIRTGQK